MIIALISSIVGLVGGATPKLLQIYEDNRRHSREVEMLRVQADLQMQVAKHTSDNRLREIEFQSNAAVEQTSAETMAAIIKQSMVPTGNKWIDGFNAVLRPTFVSLIMVLFFFASALLITGVVGDWWTGQNNMDGQKAAGIIFGSMIGDMILGASGFLFGVRASGKPVK